MASTKSTEMINFGVGKIIATPTNLADGTIIATPTPVVLGVLQEASLEVSVDIKTLYGAQQYPLAAGQGKGKVELKAKQGTISGAVLGSLYFGQQAEAGVRAAVMDFSTKIPSAAPYELSVSPPGAGKFVENLGVVDMDTGGTYTRVEATPNPGEYVLNPATGKYTFNAADKDKSILLNYEYSATAGSGQIFTITNRLMGYTPSFRVLLQTEYDGKILTACLYRAVSGKLTLPLKNEDFTVTDFEASCFSNAAGQVGYICLSSKN